jgi:hypothetical protein
LEEAPSFVPESAVGAGPDKEVIKNPIVNKDQTTSAWGLWDGAAVEIARATRTWIQYGTLAFAVICILIGAVEALFGR